VPAQRLAKRDVEVEQVGVLRARGAQLGQHGAVLGAVQDSLEDHVVAVVEEEHDVVLEVGGDEAAGLVAFAEHLAAKMILLDLTDEGSCR
jgi:hypothetical protein